MAQDSSPAVELFTRHLESLHFPVDSVKVFVKVVKDTLDIAGKVPVQWGSALNLATWEFLKQHGKELKLKGASRAGVTFFKSPANTSETQYELSRPDSELKEVEDTDAFIDRAVAFLAERIIEIHKNKGTIVFYTGAGELAANNADCRLLLAHCYCS